MVEIAFLCLFPKNVQYTNTSWLSVHSYRHLWSDKSEVRTAFTFLILKCIKFAWPLWDKFYYHNMHNDSLAIRSWIFQTFLFKISWKSREKNNSQSQFFDWNNLELWLMTMKLIQLVFTRNDVLVCKVQTYLNLNTLYSDFVQYASIILKVFLVEIILIGQMNNNLPWR